MEVWKDVTGYEGMYQVSSVGQVRRVGSERCLSASKRRNGYLYVNLSKRGRVTTKSVHELVAEAFLGKRPAASHVNHKDGDKLNNHASNLEYVTAAENTRHAYRLGLLKAQGEANGRALLTEAQARKVLILARTGVLTQQEIAERYGIRISTVRAIKGGRIWKHLTLPQGSGRLERSGSVRA